MKLHSRLVVPAVTIAGILLGPVIALAYDTTWVSAGQPLSASKLKTDLDEAQARIAALETGSATSTIQVGGKKYSVNAVYKGPTPSSYNGAQVGGYVGAKAKCETAVGSPSAHMCTWDEISRSLQVGLSPAEGRYSASFSSISTNANTLDDCNGWTDSSGSRFGPDWGSPHPAYQSCDNPVPLLCCDGP